MTRKVEKIVDDFLKQKDLKLVKGFLYNKGNVLSLVVVDRRTGKVYSANLISHYNDLKSWKERYK